MKVMLKRRGLLSPEQEKRIDGILASCDCRFAVPISKFPRKASSTPTAMIGKVAATDIVYFASFPYLHTADRSSSRSVVISLGSRAHSELSNALDLTFHRFASDAGHEYPFELLLMDDEFRSGHIIDWSNKHKMKLQFAPTEAHQQNGCIEANNRVLRAIYKRISYTRLIAAPGTLSAIANRSTIDEIVGRAVAAKNALSGSKVASAEELWTGKAPAFDQLLKRIASMLPDGSKTDAQSLDELRRLHTAQRERARAARMDQSRTIVDPRITVGSFVRIHRERLKYSQQPWIGPAQVIAISRYAVTVRMPNGSITSADIANVRPAELDLSPETLQIAHSSEQEVSANVAHIDQNASNIGSAASAGNDMEQGGNADAEGDNNTDVAINNDANGQADHPDKRIEQTGDDALSNDSAPTEAPRATNDREQCDTATNNDTTLRRSNRLRKKGLQLEYSNNAIFSTFRWQHGIEGLASEQEMLAAYHQEKQNWDANRAYEVVQRSTLSSDANILPSATVYRFKPDGALKARIAPNGARDRERDALQGFSPSMSLDSFRILCSRAANMRWRICNLDARGAYLQAENFDRVVYVTPPREDAMSGTDFVWRLLAAAYGLIDAGNLWYLTAERHLSAYGLVQCPLDVTFWRLLDSRGETCLVVVVQVDNFIITGTDTEIRNFATFLETVFTMSPREFDEFEFYGLSVQRLPDGSIVLNGDRKRDAIVPFEWETLADFPDAAPAPQLVTRYAHHIVGIYLFLGRTACPKALLIASTFGSRLKSFTVRDARKLRSEMQRIAGLPMTVTFRPLGPTSVSPRLLCYSDASHYRSPTSIENSRVGWIICLYFGNRDVHAIDWSSHKLRRVATSTAAAEAQSAVECSSRAIVTYELVKFVGYCALAPSWLQIDHLGISRAITSDGRTRLEDGYTTLDVVVLRERLRDGAIAVGWIPTQHMPADPLTKLNSDDNALLSIIVRGRLLQAPRITSADNDIAGVSDSADVGGPAFEERRGVVTDE